jgi:hypothetical protein
LCRSRSLGPIRRSADVENIAGDDFLQNFVIGQELPVQIFFSQTQEMSVPPASSTGFRTVWTKRSRSSSLSFLGSYKGGHFVRMYQHHAAREDTLVFPAWKDAVTSAEYEELNDRFEDIEHEQFGEDRFEDAARQISDIEKSLNLSDIGQFTLPSPR